MQETIFYLSNSYTCWLDKSFASRYKFVNFVIIEFAMTPRCDPMSGRL